MESNLSTEATELGTISSVYVSRAMMGGITGNGGSGGAAELIKIISSWMLIDHVGEEAFRPVNPGIVEQASQEATRGSHKWSPCELLLFAPSFAYNHDAGHCLHVEQGYKNNH